MIKYACPSCLNAVINNGKAYRCERCKRSFPLIHGIPDFRASKDPIYSPGDEEKQARIMLKDFHKKSFAELAATFFGLYERNAYSTSILRSSLKRLLDFEQNSRIVRNQMHCMAEAINGRVSLNRRLALDLGCGPGTEIPVLASEFDHVVAMDISFPALILVRKLLDERSIKNVTLVSACVEALPFTTGTFDFIVSEDVIEHVSKQREMIKETRRVIKPHGSFIFSSPNRYSIHAEPHCKVWGVGFLPRKLTKPYVNLMTNKQYTYEGKRLLSYLELKGMMDDAYGSCNWVCRNFVIDKSRPAGSLPGRLYRRVPFIRKLCESLPARLFVRAHTIFAWK